MIYGDLKDHEREWPLYPDAIIRALEWLKEADWSTVADGRYEIEGDSIADVLSYVEYNPQVMQDRFRRIAEQAVREGRISASERLDIMKAFSASMRGYTYYEK